MAAAVLLAAAVSARSAPKGECARGDECFASGVDDLRDSVNATVGSVGVRVLQRPPARPPRRLPAPDPCRENAELDALKLRWSFEPEAPAFYIKLPRAEVEFSGARCEAREPTSSDRLAEAPQAVRRYSGTKDYDLVVAVEQGSKLADLALVAKSGAVAAYYGEVPVAQLAKETVELPKRKVAKSLTESVQGKATLSPVK